MNTEALTTLLLETTLACSVAAVAVLLLRRPLRAAFGAGAVYAAWLLVPAALVAVLLPAATVPMLPTIVAIAPVLAPAAADMASTPALFAARHGVLALWLAGAVLMLVLQARRQRRFRAALGPLRHRQDGLLQATASAGLPAVLGWPARIVLPGDFEQRYDAAERELVLCHESVHLRRGDLPASAFVALLRCLFWFNPLLHHAAARFRHDQELACDAVVLRRFPASRRRYGDALLKTQLAEEPLPVGCHWFGAHPLKERIVMLKKPLPSKIRWFAGIVVAIALSLGGAMVTWAAQPAALVEPGEGELLLTLDVRIDGGDAQRTSAVLAAGEVVPFTFTGDDGEPWLLEIAVQPLADGRFELTSTISHDGAVLGEPRLIFDASGAKLAIGGKPGAITEGIEVDIQARLGGATPAAAAMMSEVGIDGPAPRYPAGAAASGESGTVMLLLSIDAEGRVVRSEVKPEGSTVAADSAMARSAQAAAMSWKLQPAIEDGKPVPSQVVVPVRFEPDARPVDFGANAPAAQPLASAVAAPSVAPYSERPLLLWLNPEGSAETGC